MRKWLVGMGVGILAMPIILVTAKVYLAHSFYRKFELNPLNGEGEKLIEATAYRNELRKKVSIALTKFSATEAIEWHSAIQSAFDHHLEAYWWLHMRHIFNCLDDSSLVQALGMMSYPDLNIPTTIVGTTSDGGTVTFGIGVGSPQ